MSTMFDRLGEMLNECLETGEFPEPKPVHKVRAEQKPDSTPQRRHIPYTLVKEFALLGFKRTPEPGAEPAGLPEFTTVRKAYARILKELHPDTAHNLISHKDLTEQLHAVTEAYNTVKKWYKDNPE